MTDLKHFDAIIIGGSYAGLSAAMALGRSLRHTLVIDGGEPCNKQTPYSHNFITQDGETPSAIASKAKEQVLLYNTVKFHEGVVIDVEKTNKVFKVSTYSAEIFTATKLIFTTGVKDIIPNIRGFSECWGISVIHCPYCHGYEVKHVKTGILANGNAAFHYAQLISNWTNDLSIFTNGTATFSEEELALIHKHQIPVVEKEIAELIHDKGKLKLILFKDRSTFKLSAMYSSPDFEQHCKIPEKLGCELSEHNYIKVDVFQKTNIDGVLAAGDNTSPFRTVAHAVASGNIAGVVLNNEMTAHDFQLKSRDTIYHQ